MKYKKLIVVTLGLLFMLVGCKKQEESAEQAKPEAAKLSIEQVKEAIEAYVQDKAGAEGKFAVEDSVENRTRQLTFGFVHESVNEKDGRYYACVNFTEAPADTLDLDFYVSVDPEGAVKVSEVVIHKVNQESRL